MPSPRPAQPLYGGAGRLLLEDFECFLQRKSALRSQHAVQQNRPPLRPCEPKSVARPGTSLEFIEACINQTREIVRPSTSQGFSTPRCVYAAVGALPSARPRTSQGFSSEGARACQEIPPPRPSTARGRTPGGARGASPPRGANPPRGYIKSATSPQRGQRPQALTKTRALSPDTPQPWRPSSRGHAPISAPIYLASQPQLLPAPRGRAGSRPAGFALGLGLTRACDSPHSTKAPSPRASFLPFATEARSSGVDVGSTPPDATSPAEPLSPRALALFLAGSTPRGSVDEGELWQDGAPSPRRSESGAGVSFRTTSATSVRNSVNIVVPGESEGAEEVEEGRRLLHALAVSSCPVRRSQSAGRRCSIQSGRRCSIQSRYQKSRTLRPEEESVKVEEKVREAPPDNSFKFILQMSRKHSIPAREVKKVHDQFLTLDKSGDGVLSEFEFEAEMRARCCLSASEAVPKHVIDSAWACADVDHNHSVCFEEFLTWSHKSFFILEIAVEPAERQVRSLAKDSGFDLPEVDRMKRVFDSCDRNNSGVIEKEEFRHLLLTLMNVKDDSDVSNNRFERYWCEIDEERSGHICFAAFLRWYGHNNSSGWIHAHSRADT